MAEAGADAVGANKVGERAAALAVEPVAAGSEAEAPVEQAGAAERMTPAQFLAPTVAGARKPAPGFTTTQGLTGSPVAAVI